MVNCSSNAVLSGAESSTSMRGFPAGMKMPFATNLTVSRPVDSLLTVRSRCICNGGDRVWSRHGATEGLGPRAAQKPRNSLNSNPAHGITPKCKLYTRGIRPAFPVLLAIVYRMFDLDPNRAVSSQQPRRRVDRDGRTVAYAQLWRSLCGDTVAAHHTGQQETLLMCSMHRHEYHVCYVRPQPSG